MLKRWKMERHSSHPAARAKADCKSTEANAETWSLGAVLLSSRTTKPTTHVICTMPVLPISLQGKLTGGLPWDYQGPGPQQTHLGPQTQVKGRGPGTPILASPTDLYN